MAGPLLGSTAPLCKTEKRYSPGDTQLGEERAPSSSLQSSMSGHWAWCGECWLDFQLPLKGLYAVHNLHNCTWQSWLADFCLIRYATHVPEPTRIWDRWRQRHGFHWRTFCNLGEWPGGWEDEQVGRYRVGGKDVWVCKEERAQMIFAAVASILDPSDEPAAACNFSIPD